MTVKNQLPKPNKWGINFLQTSDWHSIYTDFRYLQILLIHFTLIDFFLNPRYSELGAYHILPKYSLRKKCPYSELFLFMFSGIWTEYGEIRSISPYSARMWENADQNNSEYGHFSLSDYLKKLRKEAKRANVKNLSIILIKLMPGLNQNLLMVFHSVSLSNFTRCLSNFCRTYCVFWH